MSTSVKIIAGNHPKYAARLQREFDGKRVLRAQVGRMASQPEWALGAPGIEAAKELRLDGNVVFTFLELQDP